MFVVTFLSSWLTNLSLDANQWSPEEVASWVSSTFEEGKEEILSSLAEITGRKLLLLGNEELLARGLEKYPLRRAVLKTVKEELAVDWTTAPFNKEVRDWTVADVFLWLHSRQLQRFANFCIVQKITGQDLVRLTQKDLLSLGIKKQKHRTTFMSAIQTLKTGPLQAKMSGLTIAELTPKIVTFSVWTPSTWDLKVISSYCE